MLNLPVFIVTRQEEGTLKRDTCVPPLSHQTFETMVPKKFEFPLKLYARLREMLRSGDRKIFLQSSKNLPYVLIKETRAWSMMA